MLLYSQVICVVLIPLPLFSAMLALGERLAAFLFLGGALVLAGVSMAQTLTHPLVRRDTARSQG